MNDSDAHTGSIFRVQEQAKKPISKQKEPKEENLFEIQG
jgi:hypothetical protein